MSFEEDMRIQFNVKKILLTYQCPSYKISQEEYTEWITNLSNNKNITLKRICFVYKDNNVHVFLSWNQSFRSTVHHIFTYRGIRPIMRKMHRGTHVNIVSKYLNIDI